MNNITEFDPRVAQKLRELPMRTLEDVQRHFPGVEVTEEISDDHLPALRLLTTSSCRMRCQYPDRGGDLWCHDEGMVRNSLRPASLDEMLKVVRFFRDEHGVKQVNLAGLQPQLNDELVAFIRQLRAEGMTGVAFTSHGLKLVHWLPKLVEAGLTSLQLSVQGFSTKSYQVIMGLDSFENAMQVVDLAYDLKLPTAINRVLLKGYEHDIPDFLNWIKSRDLRVRLYDLMWKPGDDQHFLDFHASWQTLTHLWKNEVEKIVVWRFGQPGRLNLVFHLKGGGTIETNVSVPWEIHTAPACQGCSVKDVCTEGWMGCGIRITPDTRVQPCLWRADLSTPALPFAEGAANESDYRYLEGLLEGKVSLSS